MESISPHRSSLSDSKWINVTEKKLWFVILLLSVSYPIMFILSWFAITGFIQMGGSLCGDRDYWSFCVHGFAVFFTIIIGQPFIGFFLLIFVSALAMRFNKIDWIEVTHKWKLRIKGIDSDELIVDYPLWQQKPIQ